MVISWDPLADYFATSAGESGEINISETTFLRLWSEGTHTRWAIWIQDETRKEIDEEQKILTEFDEENQ
jgi:hypothetical protein